MPPSPIIHPNDVCLCTIVWEIRRKGYAPRDECDKINIANVYIHAMDDTNQNVSTKTKLILIDSRVTNITNGILDALTTDTDYVIFDFLNDTWDTLREKIRANYSTVCIAQHNYFSDTYQLLSCMQPAQITNVETQDPFLVGWREYIDFLNGLNTQWGVTTIDLLECNLWANEDWKYIIQTINATTHLHVRASINITGTGGDFIMESDHVDLIGIYFTDQILHYGYAFANTAASVNVYTASGVLCPTFPGAWMLNGTANTTNSAWSLFPIYGNITDYSTLQVQNRDTGYYVLPNFKLIVYNAVSYGGTATTIDNGAGFDACYNILTTTAKTGKSCRLYYNNNLLPYATPNYATNVVSSISKTVGVLNPAAITSYVNTSTYNTYVFLSSGTLTLTNVVNVTLNIMAVAGGGGGAGGAFGAYQISGGGGGEVAFKSITISGNDTVTITIGSGGNGGNYSLGVASLTTSSNVNGQKGGSTIVSFSTNTSSSFTCNGGGGGRHSWLYSNANYGNNTSIRNMNLQIGGSESGGVNGSGQSSSNVVKTAGGYGNMGGIQASGFTSGGGGGAGSIGSNAPNNSTSGSGGSGITMNGNLTGVTSNLYFGAGGGAFGWGSTSPGVAGNGGNGGGGGGGGGNNGSACTPGTGQGGTYASASGGNGGNRDTPGGNGATNSGSGGGGGGSAGGNGGSGIVIITVLKTATLSQT